MDRDPNDDYLHPPPSTAGRGMANTHKQVLTVSPPPSRTSLVRALRVLPADEVCELVAVGLASRNDLTYDMMHVLLKELNDIYWPLVRAEDG